MFREFTITTKNSEEQTKPPATSRHDLDLVSIPLLEIFEEIYLQITWQITYSTDDIFVNEFVNHH